MAKPETAALSIRANPFYRLAGVLQGLSGWHRRFVALLLGVGLSAAFAPFGQFYIIFMVFPAAFWLASGVLRPATAFATGWWFGFGHYASSWWWISNALLVDAQSHAWLIPFAALALPAFVGLFTGAAFLVTYWFRGFANGQWLIFACSWVLFEWLRGNILTGFPWNLLGYVWAEQILMMQATAWFGIYGLSLLTAVLACGLAPLALGPFSAVRCWFGPAACLVLGFGLVAAGSLRLAGALEPTGDGLRLRLVQPNIAQSQKWNPDLRFTHLNMLLALSRSGPGPRPDLVIWPETAVPVYLEDEPALRAEIGRLVTPGGAVLTGGVRRQVVAGRVVGIWNSVFALDSEGMVAAVYDKFHLVPFGEYLPFRSLLSAIGLDKIAAGALDFSAGPGPQTLHIAGLPPFSPLICYEVIFPGRVVDAQNRADWILNLTNDGWYGNTPGPYQHLAMARFRAVEEGLAVIRVAGTGISAVIDAYGRVLASLDYDQRGVVDYILPGHLEAAPLYARHGALSLGLAGLVVIGLMAVTAAFSVRPKSRE